jgi:hypothetical protein
MSAPTALTISDRLRVVTRDPFFCFEVDQFLPSGFYELLRASFPPVELCDRITTTNKRMLSPRDASFADVIGRPGPWAEFADLLTAPRFLFDCWRVTLRPLFNARGPRGARPWLRNRPSNCILRRAVTRVSVQLEFSYLENGASIEPHTDGGSKLLSLMLYFPDDEKQARMPLGTEFYRPRTGENARRWSNFANQTPTGDEQERLTEKLDMFYRPIFRPNMLVGFVKNDLSYHALRPITLQPGVYRKSLNINIVAA